MAISSPEMMLVPKTGVRKEPQQHAKPRKQTEVDVTERTATDLAANAVLVTDAKILRSRR